MVQLIEAGHVTSDDGTGGADRVIRGPSNSVAFRRGTAHSGVAQTIPRRVLWVPK